MGRRRQGLLLPSCFAVIATVLAGLHPVDNPDSFGHLAAGRQIVERGHVPSLDTFSYFRDAPQPWVNYEWLSDLLLYLVQRAGGFEGLNLLKLALVAAVAVLVVRIAFDRAGVLGARWCALVMVLAVPAVRFRLSVRPHMFGLCFSALYWMGLLAILEAAERDAREDPGRARRVSRWVFGLGCAHVVWVNMHGSHLLGVALTVVACVAGFKRTAARKPLLTLLGLELLASCVSPYGPKIVVGAIEHVFDPRYRSIVGEWQAWSPAQPLWFLLGVVLQALLVAIAWRGLPKTPSGWFQKLAAVMLLLMAARSMRFIADFLVLTAPLVGEGFAGWRGARVGSSPSPSPSTTTSTSTRALGLARGAWMIGYAAACGFAVWMSLRLPPYAAFGLGADLRTLPAASGAWLARSRPHARVFAAMEDSWFLMWAAPTVKHLIDGRVPFYGPTHMRAMFKNWSSDASLQKTIADTRTDAVIVQPLIAEHQAALASMLKAPDFRLVVIENKHALFVRAQGKDDADTRAATDSALHELEPGYSATWLLARAADVGAIRRELVQLRSEPNAAAYVAWVDAILALRPLARADGRGGFTPPVTRSEHAGVDFALERLRPLRARLEDVPSLSAYHALAALLACKLDEAEDVLDDVRDEDTSRETTFAAQELALRRGDVDEVKAFIAAARAVPEAANDPWLAGLERASKQPSACGRR
jgi:hypothetical protein